MLTKHGFAKGIAVGIAAGTAIGLITAPKSRNAKRVAGRIIRAAGEVFEDVSTALR